MEVTMSAAKHIPVYSATLSLPPPETAVRVVGSWCCTNVQ